MADFNERYLLYEQILRCLQKRRRRGGTKKKKHATTNAMRPTHWRNKRSIALRPGIICSPWCAVKDRPEVWCIKWRLPFTMCTRQGSAKAKIQTLSDLLHFFLVLRSTGFLANVLSLSLSLFLSLSVSGTPFLSPSARVPSLQYLFLWLFYFAEYARSQASCTLAYPNAVPSCKNDGAQRLTTCLGCYVVALAS